MHHLSHQVKQNGKLCWVTALMVEAKPLIDHYGLSRVKEASNFPMFRNEAENFWLVVSGVGKTKCAAASKELYHILNKPEGAAWLNIGIAGHRTRELGELRWVNKIHDMTSGENWYPPQIFRTGRRRANALMTVDQPGDYPEGDTLVDMEASGFYSAASQFSTRELVQCMKIVSDNMKTSWRELKKGAVEGFVREKMDEIAAGSEELLALSVDEMKRCAEPSGFNEMLETWHFTETEKHLMRKILRRCQLIMSDSETPVAFCQAGGVKSGKQALKFLNESLGRNEDELIVSS